MNDQVHPIFQPLLNALSQPPKTRRVSCYACFGTGIGVSSMANETEIYTGRCSRCYGEKTIEVHV